MKLARAISGKVFRRRDRVRVGDRFLTERQVSEQFGVSRATANKALANVVAEGVLEFRKGVGTFVREPLLDYDLRASSEIVSGQSRRRGRPRACCARPAAAAPSVPRNEEHECELGLQSA
jgi:DNA-binding GntR family transcriptional regulator